MSDMEIKDDVVIEKIKGYLKRLSDGEELAGVRADFVKEFKEVDAAQIMMAEQELLKEGIPLGEVQRLCDVHAALFQGKTTQEQIINAEKAVEKSMRERKFLAATELMEIPNHPLNIFTRENEELKKVIHKCREADISGDIGDKLIDELRQISIHYAKKGDLLYPHLKVKYEISGPSYVMWTVDDEIRDELNALAKIKNHDETWLERFRAIVTRVDEMIYKEENILFPNCALNFTEEEWYGIYHDSKDYAICFGVENAIWEAAENAKKITLTGVSIKDEQLLAMLNTIPIEITFVDVNDINIFFNEGPKVFKRPGMALGREVYSCHPPKIEQKVRRIIQEFKEGTLDEVPIWMDKNGRTMLVTYMAVRDTQGKYLGTMELVQDMEFAKKHFESKNKATY